jgi:hypothetical protein
MAVAFVIKCSILLLHIPHDVHAPDLHPQLVPGAPQLPQSEHLHAHSLRGWHAVCLHAQVGAERPCCILAALVVVVLLLQRA